jgi:tetratricopeptide (TPR) repeat protein
MDDNLVTQNHPLTSKGLSTIKEIFSSTYYKDDLGYSFGYRPIVHLSFAIEDAFFGESSVISHFINVLLYIFAVFLFYKLLLNWLGDEKKEIALIAALFFAIHPIHSEVVASIKNRDEILAFLFAVLSALSIHQFVNTKQWWRFLLIGLFFSLGMLSKKSIFPLVIVFPIAQFLLQRPSIKQMIGIVMALLIPTVIIGGEGEVSKSALLFLVPMVSVFGLIGLLALLDNNSILVAIWNKIKKYQTLILSIAGWLFIGIGIVEFNFLYFIIAGVLFSVVYHKNNLIGIVQIIALTFILAYKNTAPEFLDYSIFFSLYFLIFDKNKIKREYLIVIISAALGLYLFLATHVDFQFCFMVFVKICMITALFILLRFKEIYSILYSVILLFLFSLFDWYLLFIIVAFLTIGSVTKMIKTPFKLEIYVPTISFVFFLVYIGFFSLKLFDNDAVKGLPKTIVQSAQTEQFNTGIKEGRYLEYVENTLVTPHTVYETIGTGFVALGKYAQLMVYPKELSFYYGFSEIKTTALNSWEVWISIFFYFALAVVALFNLKKSPIISIGILWYVIAIFLFSNWVELVAGMVGERLAFTASAGFAILVASILFWMKPAFNFLKPQKLEWVVMAILVLFAVRTMYRNSDWSSPINLMSNDIEHLENSAQANNMYAMSLLDESIKNNDLTEETKQEYRKKAVLHLQKAIEIYPSFFNYNFDLGRSYIALNDNNNAKKAFLNAYTILPKNPLVLEELTKTCFDLGQKEETEYYGNKYLEINPRNENIHELVAYIFLLNKDFLKTNFYASRGLKYFPKNQNLNKMVIDANKTK